MSFFVNDIALDYTFGEVFDKIRTYCNGKILMLFACLDMYDNVKMCLSV